MKRSLIPALLACCACSATPSPMPTSNVSAADATNRSDVQDAANSLTIDAPNATTMDASDVGTSDASDAVPDLGPTWLSIDDRLESATAQMPMPAVAALVFDAQGTIAAGVTGHRLAGDSTPATLADKFHLGSCTKAMTAVLAARVVERGDIAWTTTVVDALDVANSDAAYTSVTLLELLSHTAGMPGSLGLQHPDLWTYLWDNQTDPRSARAEVARQLLAQQPAQPVGTFTYSNAGFIVAGAMLEAATDTPWEDLLRSEVFDPLGMASCGFGPQANAATLDQPRPHTLVGSQPTPVPSSQPWDNPAGLGPAGTVHCDLLDWAKFGRLQLGDGDGFITSEHLAMTHAVRAPEQSYALGWAAVERSWGNGIVVTHAGSNTMNYAVTWIAPEVDKGVMLVTNVGGDAIAADADQIVGQLIADHF